MSAGLDSYRNKRKDDWRGWQWNRIVERLSVPVEEAVALYLCGPADVDRAKAVLRGFRTENLIGVDLDEENVRRVRAGGGLAICADINELVAVWPKDWPVHVIVADFCAGFDDTAINLASALMSRTGAMRGTVVSVNLQRGRDATTNDLRAWLKETYSEALAIGASFGGPHDPDPRIHRGRQFLAACVNGWLVSWGEPAERLYPDYNSYRSHRVFMDSVVFRWPGAFIQRPATGLMAKLRETAGVLFGSRLPFPAASRKIAACRALRTMKVRAA